MAYVQRMKRREPKSISGRGVAQHFKMDYMGSAEFEHGILAGSLVVFRTQSNEIKKIQQGEKPFWFVGEKSQLSVAIALINQQLHDVPMIANGQPVRFKENPRMCKGADIDGWWWLSQDGWPDRERASKPTWCLFSTQESAETWLESIVS